MCSFCIVSPLNSVCFSLSLMFDFLKYCIVLGPPLMLEYDNHKLAGGPVPVKRLECPLQCRLIWWGNYICSQSSWEDIPQTEWLKTKKQKFMSHGSGGEKDIIEMWTGPCSLWNLLRRILSCLFPASGGCQSLVLLTFQLQHFTLCPCTHLVISPMSLCLSHFSAPYKEPGTWDSGPTVPQYDLILTNDTCSVPDSIWCHILRSWGLELCISQIRLPSQNTTHGGA